MSPNVGACSEVLHAEHEMSKPNAAVSANRVADIAHRLSKSGGRFQYAEPNLFARDLSDDGSPAIPVFLYWHWISSAQDGRRRSEPDR